MTLDAKIEALLFWKGEPLTIKKIGVLLGASETDIHDALPVLAEKLSGRGVALIQKEDEVMLGTAPELSKIFEAIVKEELSSDLSKASLETLTIILYRGPIAKADIDYIRGINSGFMLRALLVRGLIERIENPKDRRSFLYKPTFDLLTQLGIHRIDELPEYEAVLKEMSDVEAADETKTPPAPPSEPGATAIPIHHS